MIGFVLGSALLFAITVAFLTRPFWRKAWTFRRPAPLRALAKESEQVAALHRSGALDDAGYQRARALLEAKVMDALSRPAQSPAAAAPRSNGLVAGMVLFLGIVVVAGYVTVGSPTAIDRGAGDIAAADGNAPHGASSEQVGAMVDRLAERLKSDSGDADGWAMLARSYVALGRHRDAVPAFERAVALRADDAALWADYADALAMASERKLAGRPLELIDRALAIDPNQPKALALAGTAAWDRGDYRRAAEAWDRLVRTDTDGQLAQQMKPALEEARRLAGVTATPDAPASAGPSIEGRVTLAPELAAGTSPDDTLFVYARAQDGRRMPLSIVRKQVRDLPLAFVLDDSHSMSPDAKLSSARKVIVEARVSKSGNAIAQSGDLLGSATDVAVGARDVSIRIDQRKTP